MGISQSPRRRSMSDDGGGSRKLGSFPAESGDDCLSFQYTVDDPTINAPAATTTAATAVAAAHDSHKATAAEATCVFQYFVPSPSPTGPSCSLRLSSGNGAAEVGVDSSRISSPAAMAGRRLEYFERTDDCGETTKAATAAFGVSEPRSSQILGIPETRRKDFGKTVPVASSSVSICEGATISTAVAVAAAAEAPARTSAVREEDDCRQPRATGSHSKGLLFATLMDNIDLSQMTPSQPMQEEAGGGGATRGGEGLGGQELTAAASATMTKESEKRKAVGRDAEASCGDGGSVLGRSQSRSQPEPCERYRGLRSSSSSSRHVKDQEEGSSSSTRSVAPSTAGFRDGLWRKSAVGAANNLVLDSEDKESEAGARAGLVNEAKNSRMPPPVGRRRLIDRGAAPIVATTDLTGAPWTAVPNAEAGKADGSGGEGGGRVEQRAGLETETTLEREAVKLGGVVAGEMGCVGTVGRPRDSVDSAVRDGSPSSSCVSSSFNLDLATTPEVRQRSLELFKSPTGILLLRMLLLCNKACTKSNVRGNCLALLSSFSMFCM